MRYLSLFMFFASIFITSAQENNAAYYFPPSTSEYWKKTDFETEQWDADLKDSLYQLLETGNTRAFIVLKDGKLLIEKYWGENFRGRDFDEASYWYWASAGKTLTAFLVGIAQEQSLLDLEDPTNQYIDKWTSMSKEQENKIKIKHQLTMTTGLDYNVDDKNCISPECLKFKANPGKQWYYHNAPYTLLRQVLESATGEGINQYTKNNLASKIGMTGMWITTKENNNVYMSTPRSAARFGLLILNKGTWDGKAILKDTTYFEDMTTTSQILNPSYGYLWWLNGKGKIILPTMSIPIQQDFVPSAPKDMISAFGKNGQFIDVIPSENMVIVRMGERPNDDTAPVIFHRKFWNILKEMMPD